MTGIRSILRPHRRATAGIFVLVCLVLPVVTTLVLLWSFLGRSSALASVPVAIVNNDQAVSVGDGDSARTIAAGRQLAANLSVPQDPGQYDLDWVLTDADDAADGLASGRFYAVLTIPESFSAAITSTSGETPTQAEITVESDAATSSMIGTISEQVASAAADQIGAQASASYLDNVYLGFNSISDQMTSAADGAAQLASGTAELATSTGSVDSGARTLEDSLRTLERGAASVATGASAIADGSGELADGAARTATAASRTATATGAVGEGVTAAAQGAERVSASTRALADSAAALAGSCPPAAGPVYCTEIRALAARARVEEAATAGLARALGGLSVAASEVAVASGGVSAGAAEVSSGAATLAGNSVALSGGASSVASGTASAVQGSAALASGTTALLGGAESTSSGAQSLSSGLSAGAAAVPTYSDDQRHALTQVVTQPVTTTTEQRHSAGTQAWPAALIAASVLWLVAIASTYLRRIPSRVTAALAPDSSARTAISTLAPVFAASVVQSLAVSATVVLFGLPVASAVASAALTLLASVTFTMLVVALRTLFPRYGVLVAAVAFVAQLACASGLLPIDTAPALVQNLNGVLPLTAFANGAARVVAGSPAEALGVATVLLVWAAVALALSLLLERRRSVRRAGTRSTFSGLGGADAGHQVPLLAH